ncbi:MAG: A/G-specific adenine glycosylase, partial [Candidatus Binatia bacterium]
MTPLHRPLLRWYDRHHRRLPWRETRDPYAIWVAETMLQQTRSETVLRYYPRFLRRFSDARALARARERSVLAQWSGLGYYSRARNLHRAARLVVERHGGRLPRDPAALRALPGIGPYTAGAVASIAFDLPAPVLDGNVARVLARLFGVRGRVRTGETTRRLWKLAAALVPKERPGDWNQALMELGATLCTPRRPVCASCPLRPRCVARRGGFVGRLPRPPSRRPARRTSEVVATLESNGHYLLLREDGARLLRGLWRFPGVELRPGEDGAAALQGFLARLGFGLVDLTELVRFRHSILDRRIETVAYRACLSRA